MATIEKRNARKPLENGNITATGVSNSNNTGTNGFLFSFYIGDHIVSVTYAERVKLINEWADGEKQYTELP